MFNRLCKHAFSSISNLRGQFNSQVRSIHVEARIESLGYKLAPVASTPRGNYRPFVRTGNIIHVAGHIPQIVDGPLITGRLGETMTLEEGQHAAKVASIQMLSTLRAAVGNLDKVKKVIKLVGFVNSTSTFYDHAKVMNGCSDFMVEVFGLEIGSHARSAIGTSVLPLQIPVEIEGIVEVEED
jgi:enamine deaminase RidA (YjgF/YER057c/UK114 family)